MSATAAFLAAQTGISGTPFDGLDNTQSLIQAFFAVTPLGNYAALGDTLDLSAIASQASAPGAPFLVLLFSSNSAGDSGFVYKYRPGTTVANGKFQVMTSNGAAPNPLLDAGAGAYPAGVLSDKIVGIAYFVRF